ncbi:potassium transporter Kup [Nocardioides sp. GY 10127]|uniref:potassium transporter Kup n=1 Tax=Nocardioides sp. GY 10127 TaxID=2569762 RepID=UPI0010A8F59C|nr:potassium transporter Kup [Nocardioides sp. GY 10127]TIC82785.1 potassium transporter Kup [Nocardioides sp. GY 10127]
MDSHAGARGARAALTLGALGVVFGDIGTSPLYAVQTVFAIDDGAVKATPGDVYGVISLMFWSITLVVSVKYVGLVLRADNDGEGGVLSLAHLTHRVMRRAHRGSVAVMVLGVVGASLFYGDSVITPAISVLSAVEGVEVSVPAVAHYVLPISLAIIVVLFVNQRHGTERVGRLFGPVMVLWFLTLALLGLRHVAEDPAILTALSPHHGVLFLVEHPVTSFIALGAVVLVITGAEALFADMGHFGRVPITLAWFAVVFPALTLNYLGQGQMLLDDPSTAGNPFFEMAPSWAQLPLVLLATAATVIASQAVITGAYSVSRQAERLGYLPRLTVRQTSRLESGQIYVPSVNWLLFLGVVILMLTFRSSSALATAYGIAVTATFMLTTILFCLYAYRGLGWGRKRTIAVGGLFLLVEATFFTANVTKILSGGWLPVLIASALITVMLTWRQGVSVINARRRKLEGSLRHYLEHSGVRTMRRTPGVAVFIHPNKETVPLALRENVTFNEALHEQVVVVSCQSRNVPRVEPEDRVTIDHLGDPFDGITHVRLDFGFDEDVDVPAGLALAVAQHGLDLDLDRAAYFVSRVTLEPSDRPGLWRWQKNLIKALSHNAADPTLYFNLPIARTVTMGARLQF